MSEPTIVLHGTELSGHTHRVVLLLRMLQLPYHFQAATAEIRRSETFLRWNPLGQVPVLQDNELILADSNAILVYLAKRYAPASHWLPEEPVAAAHVQRWLSAAAGEVRYGPGSARLITQFSYAEDHRQATTIAARLLRFMDAHLSDRDFLATEYPTIADLACYSYVAHAPEGGIALDAYPNVGAWLRRIEALPHFTDMRPLPIPEREAASHE